MEENLITKRELLELTGISYGALYRWKRMKLVPDEWFIRRSTYTGSETFFPKEKMLERVEKIRNMKGDMSLDDIAQTFSGDAVDVALTPRQIADRGLVPAQVLELYLARCGEKNEFSFDDLLALRLFAALLDGGLVGQDDAYEGASMAAHPSELRAPALKILRKLGVTCFLLVEEDSRLYLDDRTKLVGSVALPALTSELKQALLKG